MTVIVPHLDSIVGQDASLFSVSGISSSGTVGTAVDFLASFKKADWTAKRKFVDTTGANDQGVSMRPTMFDKGTLTLSGFVRGTSSYAAIFASGAFVQVSFTERATTGDLWQFICTNASVKKSISGEATEDSLEFDTIGIPMYAAAGGTLAPISLQ